MISSQLEPRIFIIYRCKASFSASLSRTFVDVSPILPIPAAPNMNTCFIAHECTDLSLFYLFIYSEVGIAVSVSQICLFLLPALCNVLLYSTDLSRNQDLYSS